MAVVGERVEAAPGRVGESVINKSQLLLEDSDNLVRIQFYHDLHDFMAAIGTPIQRLPTLGFKELDLWVLYNEVIKRRGVDAVIAKKQWKEIADALDLPASCTDSGFRLRLHYIKYLEAYERAHFVPPPEIPQSLSVSLLGKRPSPAYASGSSSSVSGAHKSSRTTASHPAALSGSTGLAACAAAMPSRGSSFDSTVTAEAQRSRGDGSASLPHAKSELQMQARRASTSPVSSVVGHPSAHEFQLETSGAPAPSGLSGHRLKSLARLNANSLRKYQRVHQLPLLRSNPSKEELAESVAEHFQSACVPDESKALLDFIDALERRG
uniref:ARID domain-containing protein n=1 Tax=Erythrolobus australicus TaxID=1077150 RepID=A0A7S1TMN6_9RHOD